MSNMFRYRTWYNDCHGSVHFKPCTWNNIVLKHTMHILALPTSNIYTTYTSIRWTKSGKQYLYEIAKVQTIDLNNRIAPWVRNCWIRDWNYQKWYHKEDPDLTDAKRVHTYWLEQIHHNLRLKRKIDGRALRTSSPAQAVGVACALEQTYIANFKLCKTAKHVPLSDFTIHRTRKHDFQYTRQGWLVRCQYDSIKNMTLRARF